MATTITIQTGPLTASRVFQNDTRAQAALLQFYLVNKLGPAGATNQQKLSAVINWLVAQVVNAGVQSYIESQHENLLLGVEGDARALYDFETGA